VSTALARRKPPSASPPARSGGAVVRAQTDADPFNWPAAHRGCGHPGTSQYGPLTDVPLDALGTKPRLRHQGDVSTSSTDALRGVTRAHSRPAAG
jgi:hypothetical protein